MSIRYVTAVAIAALSAIAGPAPVQAQNQAPFATEKNTAGDLLLSYQLERQFENFVQTCPSLEMPLRVSRPRPIGGPEVRRVSAIDRRVIRELELASAPVVSATADLSLPRLFGYVYTGPTLPADRWLDSDFLQLAFEDQSLVLAPGFPQLRMNATCSSVLMGALSANAEFSVPVAALSAAAEADYSNNSRTTLRLANGRFVSPLWEMWEGVNLDDPYRAERQFYAGIVLWSWHRNRPQGDYRLLRSFDGTVIYRQQNIDTSGSVSGSTTARVGIPTATMQTSASARTSSSTTVEIADVNALVGKRSGRAQVEFAPMPTIQTIVDTVAQTTRAPVSYPDPEGPVVTSGQRRNMDVDVAALPAGLCNRGAWTVRDSMTATGTSQTFTMGEPAIVGSGAGRACRFRLVYSAPASVSGDTALTPVLVSTGTNGGSPLKLPISGVRFETTTGPRLAFQASDGPHLAAIPGSTPPTWTLGWTVKLRLRDWPPFSAIDQIDVSELTVECPAGTSMHGAPAFTAAFVGPATSVRDIWLTGSGSYAGALNAARPDTVMCKLAGDVVYRGTSGEVRLRRAAPAVDLAYPVPPPVAVDPAPDTTVPARLPQ